MNCRNCRKSFEADWKYCPTCGFVIDPLNTLGSSMRAYGSGVRAQVFEVIVRQALAGAPWQEICAGPMQVNSITPIEIELEVKRRRDGLNPLQPAGVLRKPKKPEGETGVSLSLPVPDDSNEQNRNSL